MVSSAAPPVILSEAKDPLRFGGFFVAALLRMTVDHGPNADVSIPPHALPAGFE
jgi:hypothetical protein